MKQVNQGKKHADFTEDAEPQCPTPTGVLTPGSLPRGDERYAALLDNALVWILECDPSGRIVGSNACVQQALGIDKVTELLDTPLTHHVDAAHHGSLQETFERVRHGESGELDFADASKTRWFSASFLPVEDRTGQVYRIMGVAQEITRRKMAEQALAQKEMLLRQVADHIHEVFWLCDPDRNQVWYLSPGFESIWGISRQSVMEDPSCWTRCIHPSDRERVIRARKHQTLADFDETYRIMRPDGEIRWIRDRAYPVLDNEGMVYRLTGIAEDITARRASEQALVASEARYRSIFNTMRDGLVFLAPNGEIRDANPAFLKLTGYSRKELLQLSYPELTPERWRSWEEDHIIAQLYRQGFSENYEKELIRKNGELIPVSVQCWRLPEAERDSGSLLVQMRDLSWHKRMEMDKIKLEAQLLQAQKMETIGTLAGGIAHDFNNILTPILGFAKMAQEDDGDDRRLDLDQVLKAGNRARDLVKQLLTFSRPDNQSYQPVPIYPIIREAHKMLRSTLPATIDIRMDVSNREDVVLANPTQLIQILMNLGTNAFHAMKEDGGVLQIRESRLNISSLKESPHPELTEGSWVHIEVSDTGSGMDQGTLARIFEAFFTTKSATEGTGLGLSVVQSIVANHGGVITVDSELSSGSRFQIYLPRTESAGESSKPAEAAPRGNERLILVDDEPTITLMGKKMLSRMGYQVETFNSSLAAYERIAKDVHSFDMLVTDQIMPDLTGLDLCRKVKRLRPELPIIIITGYSEKVSNKTCATAGVHDFLLKPIITAELGKAIRAALDGPPCLPEEKP